MAKSCTIRVHEDTKKELSRIGNFNDSYNTVITKLIEDYKNNQNQKQNML